MSSANSLPSHVTLAITVGTTLPKGITVDKIISADAASEIWNTTSPLRRADLIALDPSNTAAGVLAARVAKFSHEAGYAWIVSPSKELEQALQDHGFVKLSAGLFRKRAIETPEEYGENYISRWGETDFLANAELAAGQILEHLPTRFNKKTAKILDVGCLNGYIMESLHRAGAEEVYGTDISYFLAVTKHVNQGLLPNITVGDFSQNSYPTGAFDMTICMEVLEHIPPALTEKFVAELARVTQKDGILLISTSEDWAADDTHINCRNRAQWNYLFARHSLVPVGKQVIFPGFNSFVVRPAKNFGEALANQLMMGVKLLATGPLPVPDFAKERLK